MLHGDDRPVDVLVFLQCTSPFVAAADLDAAVDLVLADAADSVFSAVDNHTFLWRPDGDRVVGVNHDASRRQRRQDRDPEYRETGGFYAFRADRFAAVGHRFFDRTAVVEVPELTALEIDTEADLAVASALAPLARSPSRCCSTSPPWPPTSTGCTPTTGCWSTSTRSRPYGCRGGTGWGSSMLREAGVPFVIVSKERNPVVGARGGQAARSTSCRASTTRCAP